MGPRGEGVATYLDSRVSSLIECSGGERRIRKSKISGFGVVDD